MPKSKYSKPKKKGNTKWPQIKKGKKPTKSKGVVGARG